MSGSIARTLIMIGTALATTAVGMINEPATKIMPPQCGFYELSPPYREMTARYSHCGDSFILIKFHWNTGSTGTRCVAPWEQQPFFKDGPYRVVNGYYVKTPPNLGYSNGQHFCLTRQPQV
ncbi:DUF6355 family natural product biosynthesis protein [Lentzea sp. JNUCC 0626]|uniref:DUF6355 family natural product biosynthesis protein n=1 Tax=Lentzea sp. JNUCC 0626 TaxID=3367513 RepID=UPI00374A3D6E